MKRSERKKVEAAADESIAKIRAARSATNEVTNGIAKEAPSGDLQPLLDRATATHDAAVKATETYRAPSPALKSNRFFSHCNL